MLPLVLQGVLTSGLLGPHAEKEDPFVTSTPVPPPNQVSYYFFNFYKYIFNKLIKVCVHSPPDEMFNFQNISDGSQEGGGDAIAARNPGLATPSCCQQRQARRAGSQQPKLPDDLLCGFSVEEDGKRVCTFCMSVFTFIFRIYCL